MVQSVGRCCPGEWLENRCSLESFMRQVLELLIFRPKKRKSLQAHFFLYLFIYFSDEEQSLGTSCQVTFSLTSPMSCKSFWDVGSVIHEPGLTKRVGCAQRCVSVGQCFVTPAVVTGQAPFSPVDCWFFSEERKSFQCQMLAGWGNWLSAAASSHMLRHLWPEPLFSGCQLFSCPLPLHFFLFFSLEGPLDKW